MIKMRHAPRQHSEACDGPGTKSGPCGNSLPRRLREVVHSEAISDVGVIGWDWTWRREGRVAKRNPGCQQIGKW